MDASTEVLLFAAARAQHVAELIRPYLAAGGIVVCDRFADSTYAYQGYGLGRDLAELQTITRIATGGLQPDLTIFLDLPVADGLERKRKSSTLAQPHASARASDVEWNRLDARELAFHERVRNGYHTLMAAEPQRWLHFDGRQDRDTLTASIWEVLESRLMQLASLQGVRS
jgi:dTMP kinase